MGRLRLTLLENPEFHLLRTKLHQSSSHCIALGLITYYRASQRHVGLRENLNPFRPWSI